MVDDIRARHVKRLKHVTLAGGEDDAQSLIDLYEEIEGLLIDAERRYIFGQLERGELIDEARRHIERELDLREAVLLRNIPGALHHEE